MSTLLEQAQQAGKRLPTRFDPEEQAAIVVLADKGWRPVDIVQFFADRGIKTTSGTVSRFLSLVSDERRRLPGEPCSTLFIGASQLPLHVGASPESDVELIDRIVDEAAALPRTIDPELGI